VEMGIARQLESIAEGFKIVASFPEWRQTPVILGESDPEGCAACSAKDNPQNSYRNGPLYASYTAEALSLTMTLAASEHIHLLGSVTWAFEFEDQPPFEGFRTLATNGIDKPVLNAFRMFGLLGNQADKATSSGELPAEEIVRNGVRATPDIRTIAARRDHEIEVLVWNYHDDDVPAADAPIELTVDGLPASVTRVLLDHFQLDSQHSNAFTAWKKMGSPNSLSPDQREQLEKAGQLQLTSSPEWIPIENHAVHLRFPLPRQAVALFRLAW